MGKGALSVLGKEVQFKESKGKRKASPWIL